MSDSLERVIRERLAQHRENLGLWESGYLAPTEPDPEERQATMGRLRVAIEVLETVLKDADAKPSPAEADLDRIRREIRAQDGTDSEAEDLTRAQWAKVKDSDVTEYGAPVTIRFCGEMEGIEDHGYLTTIPGLDDDWDMVGIVHIPAPWVEKERPIPEWHSLYSLCRNELVKEIVIGERP
jgi:hypothetical protein